ncbi:DUF6455 family protein [Shimia abyssi]|uniref:DUF6455 domain-containing protein n=1 Tax=Shimia abyssi TaxID=1662395 RepID=A0A2P8FJT3_9RHOB|nr:DUF6455 family protein [Shimia abyssi]PSL21939.1 hypothetical protein CLV88_101363 [Shimia abyssi]
MFDLIKARRHAGLFDNAARKSGVDLQEAAIAGAIPVDCIGIGVTRCMACSKPDVCESWLQDAGGQDAGPPEFCRNRDMLRRLSKAVK